jgi:WD40 repeat protein
VLTIACAANPAAAEQPDIVWVASGHSAGVNSVAFSPDGQTLASGSADLTVKLWQASDGALLRTLSGHTATVLSVAFAPDGQTLASTGDWGDDTVKLWRVSDGALLQTLAGHSHSVSSVAFAPDGQTLASGSGSRPPGYELYFGEIKFWRPSDGALLQTLTPYIGVVDCLAFSPDGQTLATGSWQSWLHDYPNWYYVGRTMLWQVSDGTLLRTMTTSGPVYSVAFAPDGQTLASGGAAGPRDSPGEVNFWRVSDGAWLRTLTGHTSAVNSVAFTPDGQTLASASYDQTIRFWRAAEGTLVTTYDQETGGGAHALDFSHDGLLFAYGGLDNTVVVARRPYAVGGHVTDGTGAGIEGVVLSSLPGDPATQTDGSYVVAVPQGFSGTVIPQKAGYLFTPSGRAYCNVLFDQWNQDYSATIQTFTISGSVVDSSGAGLADVVIAGLPGDPVTQADGSYTVTVEYGFSGTATPAKAGLSFEPLSREYSTVAADLAGEDYAASVDTVPPNGDGTGSDEPNAPTTPEAILPPPLCPLAAAALFTWLLVGLIRWRRR